jgi:hypothetical protein
MSSTIYKLTRESGESMQDMQDWLLRGMVCSERSFEQIDSKGDVEILLVVFEKFYFRNGSMASLTLQCIDDGETQEATIIGTGGGEGMINLSWGANKNYANQARDILLKHGFRVVEQSVRSSL